MAGLCELLPGFLCKFPAFSDASIRGARKIIDDGFKGLVRSYVNIIDATVQPLQWFLNYLERLFVSSPWPIILIAMLAIVYFGSRNIRITIGTAVSMCAIGLLGLWNDTMVTLAMVTVCTLIAVIVAASTSRVPARHRRPTSQSNP